MQATPDLDPQPSPLGRQRSGLHLVDPFRRTLASAYAVPASGVASGVVKALGKLSGREIRSLRRAVLGLFGGEKALDNRLGSTDFCA